MGRNMHFLRQKFHFPISPSLAYGELVGPWAVGGSVVSTGLATKRKMVWNHSQRRKVSDYSSK